jgi:hypothetical protein
MLKGARCSVFAMEDASPKSPFGLLEAQNPFV